MASNQTESGWGNTQQSVCCRRRRFGIFFSFEIFNGAERSAVASPPPVSRENATWATSFLTPTLNKSMFVRRLCPSADFHLARSPCVAARCRSHAAPAQRTNATAGDTFVTIHPPLDFFRAPAQQEKAESNRKSASFGHKAPSLFI